MRSRYLLLLLAAAVLPSESRAITGVPSPLNSTVPACLVLCPLGDIPFTVVVRDFANNPIAGSTVVLDFTPCPGAYICRFRPSDPYTVSQRMLSMVTNAAGSVTFPARVGGTGPVGCVGLYADGVLLKSYALASPDQNGNGVAVTIVDVDDAIFAAKLGTLDPTADFDCDGDVDIGDQQLFFHHLSHSCDGIVDATRRSTWGTLKFHYR